MATDEPHTQISQEEQRKLFLAIKNDDLEAFRAGIKERTGTALDFKNEKGQTLALIAACYGRDSMIKELAERKATLFKYIWKILLIYLEITIHWL